MTFDGIKNVLVSCPWVLCHHINRRPFLFVSGTPFRGRTRICVCRRVKQVFRCVIRLRVALVATTHKTFRVTVQFDVPYDLEAPMAAFRVRDAARLASLSRPLRVDCDIHLAAQFWMEISIRFSKTNGRMATL